MRGVIELGKSLARVILVAAIAVGVLRRQFHEYSLLSVEPIAVGIRHAMMLGGAALIALGGGLAIIAIIDVPLALWQFNKSMRMSRQEIRDENKESDGSPEMKSRVKRVQQAMARKRMMQEVAKADVVVTNPTHYAVALRYDEQRMRAPVVVAKGQDLIAARIREIALEHKVAIVEAPPLARALHALCDLVLLQKTCERLVDPGFIAARGRDLEHHQDARLLALGHIQLRHRAAGEQPCATIPRYARLAKAA